MINLNNLITHLIKLLGLYPMSCSFLLNFFSDSAHATWYCVHIRKTLHSHINEIPSEIQSMERSYQYMNNEYLTFLLNTSISQHVVEQNVQLQLRVPEAVSIK